MQSFALLLDSLSTTPSRNGKLALLSRYFRDTPDPARGYALAALTDGLLPGLPLRRLLTEIMDGRIDPVLYALSRDFVGDTAETVALMWPVNPARETDLPLDMVVAAFETAPKENLGAAARVDARPPRCPRPLGAVKAAGRRPARRRLGAPRQAVARRHERPSRGRHRGSLARDREALCGSLRLARGPG